MKLQISGAKKSYGAQDVLSDAFLQIRDKEKIALVGRNGCGKTTLLEIISGQLDMDSGQLIKSKDTKIGYLAQISFFDEERTVEEELNEVFEPLIKLEYELQAQAKVIEKDHSEKQLEKYDRLQIEFETKGGYTWQSELKTVFFHFGFTESDLKKKISEYSSGQRTRIALVKLLLEKPDILLLDEPTNHLDLDSIEWLENYIKHYPSAVVLVSHDRMFLDAVADEVVEIEFGKTTRYPGNYSHYVKAKKEWLVKNHEAYLRQQKDIERLEGLIEKFRYKKNKAAFAQSKIKYLDRLERIEDSKSDTSSIHASFHAARRGGNRVLEVDNLGIGYDGKALSHVTFEMMRTDRVGIVGPNGIGKSTLVKTIMEKLKPISGEFKIGHQIDIGYFDQDSAHLKSSKNVIDELWDEYPQSTQTEIRNALASFLFTGEEVFKEVNDLSGGEKVRLALAKLMMANDNFLILDEPTNHLDIPAKEALEDALEKYDGTLLFVSHDRMFLKKMADKVLEIGNDSHFYDMDYMEYQERKKAGTLAQVPVTSKKKSMPIVDQKAINKQNFQERKQMQNRVKKLEELLEAADVKLEEMKELRYEPEYYQDYRKMEELENQIDEQVNLINAYTKEWEEKMEIIESES